METSATWNRSAGLPRAQCGLTTVMRLLAWGGLILGGLVAVITLAASRYSSSVEAGAALPLLLGAVGGCLGLLWAACLLDCAILGLRLRMGAEPKDEPLARVEPAQ